MEQDKHSPDSNQFSSAQEYTNLGREMPARSPEMGIDEHAPQLSSEQQQVLTEQWERFWELRGLEVSGSPETAIPEGALIHQMAYSPDSFKSVMQSGIISGEIAFGDKAAQSEDMETHYCADFFVSESSRTVPEYINFAQESEPTEGLLKVQRMERYALPSERSANMALVINPEQPGLQDLLENSATAAEHEQGKLDDWPLRFPRTRETEVNRHQAVLVGVPANYISEIIVGGRLAGDAETLAEMKQMIEEAELKTKLVNISGEPL